MAPPTGIPTTPSASFFTRQRTPLVVTALVAGAGTFYYLKMKAVRERSEQAKREGSKDNFYVTPGRSGGGI